MGNASESKTQSTNDDNRCCVCDSQCDSRHPFQESIERSALSQDSVIYLFGLDCLYAVPWHCMVLDERYTAIRSLPVCLSAYLLNNFPTRIAESTKDTQLSITSLFVRPPIS